jgi:16S rRNA (guanine527-N7)-methyltransferase
MKTLPEMSQIWQQTLNWQPSPVEQIQFQQLYQLILQGNESLNLTRITQTEEFWEKHLWDSLRPVFSAQGLMPLLQQGANVIDIGTGAGFPGFAIAIVSTKSQVTLLDATRKKIHFIDKVVAQTNLTHVKTLIGRAEEIGQLLQHRQSYDLAVIRAVGDASVCAEYSLPLLKHGGLALIYRGTWTPALSADLATAVEQLGGILEHVEQFTTPLSQSVRHCLHLRKVAHTPLNFPRPIGIPAQKPL